jgi:Flp pilus assembly protein CpaB
MKGGSKLFLVAGVGLAIVAIGLLVVGMSGGSKADATKQEAKVEEVTVVQAAVPIPAHTLLKAADLLEVKMPATEAPVDAVHSPAEVINLSYRVPLAQGQTLLNTQTEQPGIRNDIGKGMRAASIPVDEVSMLSGLVQDGDYVDVVFHARIDLVRLLPTNFAETPEDQPSFSYSVGKSGDDGGNGSGGSNDESGDGGDSNNALPETQSGPILWVAAGMEVENHPATGDPGSKFFIRDMGQQLEPVAKVIVQDVKVLRVVRAGESFSADGTLSGQSLTGDNTTPASEEVSAHLILQVTPAQAEALTFMQDQANQHTYQIVVRGKDDHEKVQTTGVTFQLLASDGQWSLPWPQSVTAPKTQVRSRPPSRTEGEGNQGEGGEAAGTPTAEASPTATNP